MNSSQHEFSYFACRMSISSKTPIFRIAFPLTFQGASGSISYNTSLLPPYLYVYWSSQPPLHSVINRPGHIIVAVTLSGGGSTLGFSAILFSSHLSSLKLLAMILSPQGSYLLAVTRIYTYCLYTVSISLYFMCIQMMHVFSSCSFLLQVFFKI